MGCYSRGKPVNFVFRLMLVFTVAVGAYFFMGWYGPIYDLQKNHGLKQSVSIEDPPAIIVESPGETLRGIAGEADSPRGPKTKSPPAEGENAITSSEFNAMTRKALKMLPRQSDTAGLTANQVHYIPPPILSKIRILGEVADLVQARPDLKSDAANFYKKCALDGQIIATVRARCLAGFRRHGADLGLTVDDEAFPPDVVRLSKYIP